MNYISWVSVKGCHYEVLEFYMNYSTWVSVKSFNITQGIELESSSL
jgi:hypothetical protein